MALGKTDFLLRFEKALLETQALANGYETARTTDDSGI